MSKFSVAMKLADEAGVSLSKSQKFIDDVGLDTARKAADDAAQKAGAMMPGGWWKPAAGAGVVGGGALAWRQQDLKQAEAIASQAKSYDSALAEIMDSDLSPQAKRELAQKLTDTSPGAGGDNGSGGDGDGGGLLPGGMQTTIVLLIVLVFGMKFALDGGMD